MLPRDPRTWTTGQFLLAMMSILPVLDATTTVTTDIPRTTAAVPTILTQSLLRSNPISTTVQSSSLKQPSDASSLLTEPTVPGPTVPGLTTTTLSETNEPHIANSTHMKETFTTLTSNVTDSRDLVSQDSENTTFPKTEPTVHNVQPPNSETLPQSTSLITELPSSQAPMAPGSITCIGFGSFTSTSQVACFHYEEETTCETLDEKKKEELRSFLCDIMNITHCDVTIHSSEVQPKCILWVPTSTDAKDRLQDKTYTANKSFATQIKWGQILDHQTRSQKTMIALVTCGVLLAAFILAGYFLSNRESWSPGRQRLGEDPYCTETDSQGNTLVSVSAHSQDKPNTDARENGTGQTVSPAATNGHSTKKQTVSDTEL
ncbi:hematopoietic progenitor cell antigen CD34 [Eleutherodactylus coqui]|uniref:hematopoietic progenitor cell antigen CD34 n=1 Tax=Eleutherodactylus coqui TaxID=57060 RepID=UPI003462B7B6